LGAVIAFDGFGTKFFFGEEFYRRAEEVMEKSPFLTVEVIEERDYVRMIESLIA
jgi:hypothetical protein